MLNRKGISYIGYQVLLMAVVWAGSVLAQTEPDRAGLGQAEFQLDELSIQHDYRLPHNLPGQAAAVAQANLAALGLSSNLGRVDMRGGRWAHWSWRFCQPSPPLPTSCRLILLSSVTMKKSLSIIKAPLYKFTYREFSTKFRCAAVS